MLILWQFFFLILYPLFENFTTRTAIVVRLSDQLLLGPLLQIDFIFNLIYSVYVSNLRGNMLAMNLFCEAKIGVKLFLKLQKAIAGTYLQLPLQQWGAGNVYLLVLSS